MHHSQVFITNVSSTIVPGILVADLKKECEGGEHIWSRSSSFFTLNPTIFNATLPLSFIIC